MSAELIVITLVCFAGGVVLSMWHTRRRFRAHLADRIAREVERELARRALNRFAAQQQDSQQPPSA
ncbi:hypothetical protein AAG565_08470 [Fontimonas sp. SYSU GA230001]|uniref:hypothetical protein n=1 Tax=Fontimonas sp. SYSU GA230001 TaxID=3142450 RepID=UPI0032B5364A